MKKYSAKRSVQLLAHVLQQYGIDTIVISPGSRNAPLSIHFSEIDNFKSYSLVDERSAAYTALGMAQSLRKPVAITCTSGSAAANYYPAVTEAFYQNVPLLILTADRPSDYTDIFDGQTIRQKNLYQQHSYGDFQLLEDSVDGADEFNLSEIKKAIELCIEKRGPVHINIPLEEPLYEMVTELPLYPHIEKTIRKKEYELLPKLVADWNAAKRILILTGTLQPSEELSGQLLQMVKNHTAVVLTEVTSNLKHDKYFSHIDRYIFNFSDEDFTHYGPDLLITVGQNVISKKVKQFLRKARPKNHWHIDDVWQPDTYFALTQKIETRPENFFRKLLQKAKLEPSAYFNLWDTLRHKTDMRHFEYVETVPYSDFYVVSRLADSIPAKSSVHFSNSSSIRYGQLFEFEAKDFYCNRGTSGIDGCTSTAIGFAMQCGNPVVLITGDLSFFYDVNGLWNNYIPPFTRIVILNNGEGNIFRIIPGPSDAPDNALDEFIVTKHRKTAESIAKHFGFSYSKVSDENTLERVLGNFFKPSTQPKILEIMTHEADNAEILKSYFKFLKL